METHLNRSFAWLAVVVCWIATKVSSFHTPVAFRRLYTSRLYEKHEQFPLQLVLIDHYDSYTYNLYHILAELCVVPPLVLSKDFTGPLPECDGLILSPGPGSPQHATDMGRTLQIIEDSSDLPILGVCLGHQALGHVYGASVQRAPCGPVHGQVREVMHQQVDALWNGISSPLSVVRYHSLVVNNLQNSPLIETAWCEEEDGTRVLMGLSHPIHPHYGVQFHPESIGTEQGKELLRNFCLICMERRTTGWKPPLQTIPPKTAPRIAKNEQTQYQVWIHKVEESRGAASYSVFEELYGNAPHAVWLDSSSSDVPPQTNLSRISIMAANDGPLSQRIEYYGQEHQDDGGLFVTDVNGVTNEHKTDVLSYLDSRSVGIESVQQLSSEFERTLIDENDLPFDYRGGFLGYLGYEVRHDTRRFLEGEEGRVHAPMERSQSRSNVPTAAFLFCDQSIVYDHWKKEYYLIGVTMQGSDPSGLLDWMKSTSKRLRCIGDLGSKTTPAPEQTSASSTSYSPSFRFLPNRSRETYEMNIAQCHEEIRNGETYELCLTNQLEVQASDGKPLNLYHILRKRNPAPFSAFVRFESPKGANFSICCSSPERFVSVKRTHESTELVVEAKPIKGTASRPRPPEGRELSDAERLEDTRRAQELEGSIKNRAENLMIVDLLRNDLSRVCMIGSVHVPKLMSIESYATVHQMVSTIRGRLDPLLSNSVDVLKACFPGGSMTGAPKLRTMDILHEMEEGVCRGPYSGCLGYLSLNGCMDMNIVIRSAVAVPSQRQHGWDVSIGAGGAITALSESNDEYEEMLLKASAIMEAVQEWEKEAKLCSNTEEYSFDRTSAEQKFR